MVTPFAEDRRTGVIVMHLDITQQTRAAIERTTMEAALFAEKERAQVTLNSIGDAVVCTDISGNLTFFNAVAENLAGWPWHEAAGRPMGDVLRILNDTSRETIPDPMAMAIRLNLSANLPPNCILVRRDGSEIPIEDSVAPIHDREGEPIGAVMVFRDVSADPRDGAGDRACGTA